MDTTPSTELSPLNTAERSIVAQELASAFGRMVKSYRDFYKRSPEEAVQLVEALAAPEFDEFVFNKPPDEVSWFDLDHMAQRDPALALRRWTEVRAAARDELVTGHRAAVALEPHGSDCWARARFIELRDDLSKQWQPRNGIEWQLIDTMAQAQTAYLFWLERATVRATVESISQRRLEEAEGKWAAPRVTDAEATEQAAAMVDRFNRIFLRTLRALRDLRRDSHSIVVKRARQVNIAENQVNVSQPAKKRKKPKRLAARP